MELSSAVAREPATDRTGAFRDRCAAGRIPEGFCDTAGPLVLDGALATATFLGFGKSAWTEGSEGRLIKLPAAKLGATVERLSCGSAGVPPAGSRGFTLPVALINFDGLEGFAGFAVFKTCGGALSAFTLAATTTTGASRGSFLAGSDFTGLSGTAGMLFFLGTLPLEGALVCASRLIGSGVTRGGFTAGFEEVRFAVRVAALGATEELAFRGVERTREAALFLPALAVRNLPFFIAIVSLPPLVIPKPNIMVGCECSQQNFPASQRSARR